MGAVAAGASHLVVLVDLVELEDGKLGHLVVVLGLLGLGVGLLLALLTTTAQTQNQVKGRLLLDVVIRNRS
jgi:hypothetical protein